MVAQTHTGRTSGTPGVHIAVADFGPGFGERLRKAYGRLSDEDAILKGFEDRVSSTGQPDRGFGLGYIREAVDNYHGAVLHVLSRRGFVKRCDGRFESTRVEDFPGTLAAAYFPIPSHGYNPAS